MKKFNEWGVPYSTISWFFTTMQQHSKVKSVEREKDILFTIIDNDDRVYKVLLLDEYKLGLATLMKALTEFPNTNYIVIGGDWNSYTNEAKKYGLENNIGIFNFSEFMGAINTKNPLKYKKVERENNAKKSIKGA